MSYEKNFERKVQIPEIGYNGELVDPVTKFYFLGKGYRLYNPKLRFFYSKDDYNAFDGGTFNRYHYTKNNPINYTDPTGHNSLPLSDIAMQKEPQHDTFAIIGYTFIVFSISFAATIAGGPGSGFAAAALVIDIIALTLHILSAIIFHYNQKAAETLDYVAAGLDTLSVALMMITFRLRTVKIAKKVANREMIKAEKIALLNIRKSKYQEYLKTISNKSNTTTLKRLNTEAYEKNFRNTTHANLVKDIKKSNLVRPPALATPETLSPIDMKSFVYENINAREIIMSHNISKISVF